MMIDMRILLFPSKKHRVRYISTALSISILSGFGWLFSYFSIIGWDYKHGFNYGTLHVASNYVFAILLLVSLATVISIPFTSRVGSKYYNEITDGQNSKGHSQSMTLFGSVGGAISVIIWAFGFIAHGNSYQTKNAVNIENFGHVFLYLSLTLLTLDLAKQLLAFVTKRN